MIVEQEVREDFRSVFKDLNELHQARAAQAVVNEGLKDDIASLKEDIERLAEVITALTSAIDRSRGALYVIGAASGIAGAIASVVVRSFITKP